MNDQSTSPKPETREKPEGEHGSVAVGRTLDDVMQFFRAYAEQIVANYRPTCAAQYRGLNIEELRGKKLACWCPLDKPCHADILAELANRVS